MLDRFGGRHDGIGAILLRGEGGQEVNEVLALRAPEEARRGDGCRLKVR